MKAVAVTLREGGEWQSFKAATTLDDLKNCPRAVHSIVFDNGAVWDTVNGWRDKSRREALPRYRVKMGRAVA